MQVSDLLKLDVNKHIEKKNGLSYLSWAWAWDQALRADPTASFRVESWTDDNGAVRCWMQVNDSAMVWVSVTMLGQTRSCMLPVMNSKNEPISVAGRVYTDKWGKEKIEHLDAFNVNTAIMRCLTKCLALFGLGLYIYAGEDLPLDDGKDEKKEEKKEEKSQAKEEEKKEPSAEDQLFTEGMIKYVEICATNDGLKSYWKANLPKLKALQTSAPALYEEVRRVFAQKKEQFSDSKE